MSWTCWCGPCCLLDFYDLLGHDEQACLQPAACADYRCVASLGCGMACWQASDEHHHRAVGDQAKVDLAPN